MATTGMEVIPSTGDPSEVAVAGPIIPYPRDDEKARYLSYMARGFSVREALHLIDRSKTFLSLARREPVFADLERRIPEFKKTLSKEYTELEFFRNFTLVLEKDYRVLKTSLQMVKDKEGNTIPLSQQDHAYLLKMRSNYTPQQLSILEAVVAGTDSSFNWARIISENPEFFQATRETVTVKR